MDYKRLKLKIKEIFDTQEAFGEAMNMSKTALNQRLNGKVAWKGEEIAKACDLLGVDLADAYLYFFTPKVQKTVSEG